jgi:hypothetical protein
MHDIAFDEGFTIELLALLFFRENVPKSECSRLRSIEDGSKDSPRLREPFIKLQFVTIRVAPTQGVGVDQRRSGIPLERFSARRPTP